MDEPRHISEVGGSRKVPRSWTLPACGDGLCHCASRNSRRSHLERPCREPGQSASYPTSAPSVSTSASHTELCLCDCGPVEA